MAINIYNILHNVAMHVIFSQMHDVHSLTCPVRHSVYIIILAYSVIKIISCAAAAGDLA